MESLQKDDFASSLQILDGLFDATNDNLAPIMQNKRKEDLLSFALYLPSLSSDEKEKLQITKGLDILRDLLKQKDEDQGTSLNDFIDNQSFVIEKIQHLSDKKKGMASEAFKFLQEVYSQLKVSPSGYLQMSCESFISSLPHTHSEDLYSNLKTNKIYLVGALVDRWTQFKDTLNEKIRNDLQTDILQLLSQEAANQIEKKNRDQIQLLENLQVNSTNTTTGRDKLIQQLLRLFADKNTAPFLSQYPTVTGKLQEILLKFKDVEFYQKEGSPSESETMAKFFSKLATLHTLIGVEPSNKQGRVRIEKKQVEDYRNNLLQSPQAQPIFNFVDLTGSDELYNAYQAYLSSEAYKRYFSFRTKLDTTDAITVLHKSVNLLETLNPNLFVVNRDKSEQNALDELQNSIIGESAKAIGISGSIDYDALEANKDDPDVKNSIDKLVSEIEAQVENIQSKSDLITKSKNQKEAIANISTQLALVKLGQSLAKSIQGLISGFVGLVKYFYKEQPLIEVAENPEEPQQAVDAIDNNVKKADIFGTTLKETMTYVGFYLGVLGLLSTSIKGGLGSYQAKEWYGFISQLLSFSKSLYTVVLTSLPMMGFAWATTVGAYFKKSYSFEQKYAEMFGFDKKMDRGNLIGNIAGRALSLISAVMSIWNAALYIQKAISNKDTHQQALYIYFATSYLVIGIMQLVGVAFPPFAVFAGLFSLIQTFVTLFNQMDDVVTTYVESVINSGVFSSENFISVV